MTDRQLECFLSLARSLNFSATARELFLSQPAVSQQIRALEADLGVTLFTRSTQGVALTAAGRSFYPDAWDLWTYTRTVLHRVRHSGSTYARRLDVSYALALKRLPQILAAFHARHPDTLVQFHSDHDLDRTQQLLSGRSDVVIGLKAPGRTPAALNFTELYQGRYICILPAAHPLASHPQLRLEELAGWPIFLLNDLLSDEEIRRLNAQIAEAHGLDEIHPINNFGEGAILAEAGFGVAVLPDFYHTPHAGSVHIPLVYPEPFRLGLFCRRNAGPQAKSFCRLAAEACAGDTGSPLID